MASKVSCRYSPKALLGFFRTQRALLGWRPALEYVTIHSGVDSIALGLRSTDRVRADGSRHTSHRAVDPTEPTHAQRRTPLRHYIHPVIFASAILARTLNDS